MEGRQRLWARLFERISAHMEHLEGQLSRDVGLSAAQAMFLRKMDPERGLPMSSLACTLKCDASNVTWMVDRLERDGLLERVACPGDRRVRHIVLTPKGVEVRQRVEALFSEVPPWLEQLPGALVSGLEQALDGAASAAPSPDPA